MKWQIDLDVDDVLIQLGAFAIVDAGPAWVAYAPNETPVLCDTLDDAAAVVRERMVAFVKRAAKKKAAR